MKKKRKKRHARAKVHTAGMRLFGLEEEVSLDLPRVFIQGMQRVSIDNYTDILEYGTNKVRIDTEMGILSVFGSDMVLDSLESSRISVSGQIFGAVYEGMLKS
ncbi:MAG: YabP/YqfC family sporulation protein [Christensenellales bacterium]|jgi:sporulation protein YqfC